MDPQTPAAAPAPPDMEALAVFNPHLASQALAQLYADGHRELALGWGLDERLDPFLSGTLRKAPDVPAREPMFAFLHLTYCSLFGIALSARDQGAIERLGSNPEIHRRMFSELQGEIARACANALKDHPAFAAFLFTSFPETEPTTARPSSYDSPLDQLAEASCRERRLDWLPKLQRLKRAFDKGSLDGWDLAKKHFLPQLDVEGCSALLGTGCLAPERCGDLARQFGASDEPGKRAFALRLLELEFDRVVQKEADAAPGQARFNRVFSPLALWRSEPDKTPRWWLEFHLDKGLDPFASGADGTRSVAFSLLGSARGASRRQPDANRADAREHDDRCSDLLSAMILSRPGAEAMQTHFDSASLEAPVREIFKGSRKLDLLALCIGQGYYRCADALVSSGLDPKFAAQQCSKWLKSHGSSLDPESREAALAYCEALLLRKTSIRASARRDARMEAQGASAPEAPPTRRL